MPPVLTSRLAGPADAAAIAEIHVDAWRTAYRGIVPSSFLDSLSKEKRTLQWQRTLTEKPGSVILAYEENQLRGWISSGLARDAEGGGEIYALYLSPGFVRKGIGGFLLNLAEVALSEAGHPSSSLWVLADNAAARRFYERKGYAPDGSTKAVGFGDVTLNELRYAKALEQAPA